MQKTGKSSKQALKQLLSMLFLHSKQEKHRANRQKSKQNSECTRRVILLTITDGEK